MWCFHFQFQHEVWCRWDSVAEWLWVGGEKQTTRSRRTGEWRDLAYADLAFVNSTSWVMCNLRGAQWASQAETHTMRSQHQVFNKGLAKNAPCQLRPFNVPDYAQRVPHAWDISYMTSIVLYSTIDCPALPSGLNAVDPNVSVFCKFLWDSLSFSSGNRTIRLSLKPGCAASFDPRSSLVCEARTYMHKWLTW